MAITRRQERSLSGTGLIEGQSIRVRKEKKGLTIRERPARNGPPVHSTHVLVNGAPRKSSVQVVIERTNRSKDHCHPDSNARSASSGGHAVQQSHNTLTRESEPSFHTEQQLSEPILIVKETQDIDTGPQDDTINRLQVQRSRSISKNADDQLRSNETVTQISGAVDNSLGKGAIGMETSTRKSNKRRKRAEDELEAQSSVSKNEISSHKRFKSEEPQDNTSIVPSSAFTSVNHRDISEMRLGSKTKKGLGSEIEDSEDDAPEEVTAMVGKQQSKAVISTASKAIRKEEERKKAKRRQRDFELKEQAEASKTRKANRSKYDSEAQSQEGDKQSQHASGKSLAEILLRGGPLPETLPEEILAMESEPNLVMPPLRHAQNDIKPNKRKILEKEMQPAKDRQYGSTHVRVLPKTNPHLPPPVVKHTANIRGDWLKQRAKQQTQNVAGYRMNGAGARGFLVRKY